MSLQWQGGCGSASLTSANAGDGIEITNTGGTPIISIDPAVSGMNNVVLKTLTVAGWQLNGTTYEQTISFNAIHSNKPVITACGATLGSLATDEQYAALAALKVLGDTEAKTMTFYAASAPGVGINLSIQGVE